MRHPLEELISLEFENIRCSKEAKAYLISLFSTPNGPDPIGGSLVLEWGRAVTGWSFYEHQKIGDWITWRSGYSTTKLEFNDINIAIGSAAYYKCYIILNHKWDVYKELSTDLSRITSEIRDSINRIKSH